jgi:hypothetical protein
MDLQDFFESIKAVYYDLFFAFLQIIISDGLSNLFPSQCCWLFVVHLQFRLMCIVKYFPFGNGLFFTIKLWTENV